MSSVVTADGEAGARHGDFERVGVDAQYDDMATLRPTIASAWVNVDFEWYQKTPDGASITDTRRQETWRVELVRESGAWRVCGFAPTVTLRPGVTNERLGGCRS